VDGDLAELGVKKRKGRGDGPSVQAGVFQLAFLGPELTEQKIEKTLRVI